MELKARWEYGDLADHITAFILQRTEIILPVCAQRTRIVLELSIEFLDITCIASIKERGIGKFLIGFLAV